MSIALLDIPDDPAAWPSWLEGELVSLQLHQLVAQLQLLAGHSSDASLQELLIDDDIANIKAGGLGVLSQQQIGSLLKNPSVLYPLQELVLSDTEGYWQNIPCDEAHQKQADALISGIQARLDAESGLQSEHDSLPGPLTSETPKKRTGRIALLGTLATALVIGFVIRIQQPPPGPSWGFAKSDLANIEVATSAEYFNLLADAGNEWFNKTPANADQLKKRLETFSDGCQVLIEAPHDQLATSERDWLVTKCKAWKEKIDNLIVRIDEAPEELSQVQLEADEVVNRLVSALRTGPV